MQHFVMCCDKNQDIMCLYTVYKLVNPLEKKWGKLGLSLTSLNPIFLIYKRRLSYFPYQL